jgi:hypothetical protein
MRQYNSMRKTKIDLLVSMMFDKYSADVVIAPTLVLLLKVVLLNAGDWDILVSGLGGYCKFASLFTTG